MKHKFNEGCMWEGDDFYIHTDHECSEYGGGKMCRHCHSKETKVEIVPNGTLNFNLTININMENETTIKHETANSDLSDSGSYIIRIYDQDLCSDWVDKGGYQTPNKYISKKELINDLKNNGLKIVQFAFSLFGSCYFLEVEGEYVGKIIFQKLDTKAQDFCWSV